MNRFTIQLIAFAAGCVILFVIAKNLIADHQVPSLSDLIASSTALSASSTASLISSLASSTVPTASSTVEIANATSSALLTPLYAPRGTVHAMIADTDASREQGLSGHAPLPANAGMLFVFDTPGQYGFWMKDMNFSLDMVWINADKTVAGVTKDLSPDTYPSIFMPPNPIQYVLEIDAGSADSLGLVPGASVRFNLP